MSAARRFSTYAKTGGGGYPVKAPRRLQLLSSFSFYPRIPLPRPFPVAHYDYPLQSSYKDTVESRHDQLVRCSKRIKHITRPSVPRESCSRPTVAHSTTERPPTRRSSRPAARNQQSRHRRRRLPRPSLRRIPSQRIRQLHRGGQAISLGTES